MSERIRQMDDFVEAAGWGDATRDPIKGDASTRSYVRLRKGPDTAVLMNAPVGSETASEPEGATIEARKALGYNALARLAGPNMEAFLAIAQALTQRGYSAPRILAADVENGFALLEDLGDSIFAHVVDAEPDCERALYEAAVDVLAAIYRSTFPTTLSFGEQGWRLRVYDEAALLTETDLLIDYYASDVGVSVSDKERAVVHDTWRDAFKALEGHPYGLCLRDFHAENLFWLPERDGLARVGLIDFQDGLFAHPAYDLVSLLEDARRDVSPDLHTPLIQRFCNKAGLNGDEAFHAAYAVMGAQRNAKIIGIFTRLAVRDGKPQYRKLIPRVQAHFQRDLEHPACSDLKAWYEHKLPELFE